MKQAKILFFVAGHAPTAKDFSDAAELGGKVAFRNASAVSNEQHSLEDCDGVAGCVPPVYAKQYPTAEEAIAKKKAEFAAMQKKVPDEPAPKPASTAQAKPATKGKAAAAKPTGEPVAPTAPKTAPSWNPNPAQ